MKDNDKLQLAKLAVADVISAALEQVLDTMRSERNATIKSAWEQVDSKGSVDFQRAAYLAARAVGEERAIDRLMLEKNENQLWINKMAAACVEMVLKEYGND